MAAKLYSISLFNPFPTPADVERVDQLLGQYGDWIRFSPTQWFLWSTASKGILANTLISGIGENQQIIIAVVQPEAAAGRTLPGIWAWLNDKMEQQFMGKD